MSKTGRPSRPTPADHRRRYRRRKLAASVAAALVLAGLIAAERLGVFGQRTLPDFETYHGKTFRVTRVIDGDTLDIDHPDRRNGHRTTRIRLWGVDTPETVRQNTPVRHFGPEASEFTRQASGGRDVRLELIEEQTRDRYKRLLAYIYLPDGRMLNAELIVHGCGYADPRFDHPRKREFAALQREARAERRGLWKDARPEDLPHYYQGKISVPGPN